MGDQNAFSETSIPIRVLAADKTRMNSQLLADVLTHDESFRVIEAEPTHAAIVAAAGSESPDVVLLSSVLGDNSTLGFQVARDLRTAYPKIRIIMLLDVSERESVVEAFRAGARGVFSRTESLNNLAKCIRSAHAGQVWANSVELGYLLEALSEAMPVRWGDSATFPLLSKREQDVVRSVADGLSNREIAQRLNLTEHTVKNYLFRIFDKLGVSSRVEVVLYAFRLAGPPSAPHNNGAQSAGGDGSDVASAETTVRSPRLSARRSQRRASSNKT